MHYKELKKIKRVSAQHLSFETIIAQDFSSKQFVYSVYSGVEQSCSTRFEIKRNIGAGLHFEITKVGKRSQSISVELGKSEIEMLKAFIASVESELTDFNGKYVPTKLIDLTTAANDNS